MLLVVGLGNPGPDYARHRHNVGFMAVEAIADRHGFSAPRARFQGVVREGLLAGEKCLVLMPQTYMNDSGRSVGEALRFYKLTPADLVVFHDELDLAPGKLKAKTGGGAAGHNGLRSIDAHVGQEYRRIRVGIGHPGSKARVTGYVLGDFSKADADWLAPLLDAIAASAPSLVKSDAAFLNDVALKLAPPARAKPDAAGTSPDPKGSPSAPTPSPKGPLAEALAPLTKKND